MELSPEFYVVGVWFAVTLVLITWRILDPLWFHPKKIEGSLRAQGLKGSSYKFMFGDSKEMAQMTRQAKSKPIDLKDDIGTRVLPFVQKSVAAYGKMCFTWMGPTPTVQVSEPAIIKEILADYYKFQKSRGHPLFRKLMKGLIDVEGDQWVKHRKIINPAFHLEKLKQMIPAFYVSCDDMIQKWKELVINESSCEVDVCPYIEAMSNDVISRTAFGSSFEEGRKIFELLHELLVLVVKSIQSDYFPGSRLIPTARNRRMTEIDQKVKDSIRVIVDKRLVAMKAGEIGSSDDLLGILLKSNNEEIKQDGNTKSGLSIEEIIEECKLFYVAGQETTRNVLIWTMVLLGQHTDWQARARDEVLHIFKDKKPDFEGLSHLKVVNMIFNEVLRLYPPVALLGRKIHKETKLGDIMLPAGTLVQVNTLLLHYDSEIWGDDVDEFKPERFSEGVSKVTKGLTCYLPFGGGPRICIGQNYAILEAKLVLAMILQNFAFEISPSYAHAPHLLGTIQPQFGTHLILHKL